MPQKALSVAENLAQLAREFKSGDPVTASALRYEFKTLSKNDVVRSVVYLMEVIGSRDEQFKALQSDNKDLQEILKLNDINLEEEFEKLNAKDKDNAASSPEGSNGVAATGVTQDTGTGGVEPSAGTAEEANGAV